jgi:antirestriction protein ArdC
MRREHFEAPSTTSAPDEHTASGADNAELLHRGSQSPEGRGEDLPRQTDRVRRVGRSALRHVDESRSTGGEGESSEREHVYDKITKRIIQALEAGTVPWQRPWGVGNGWPRSMATGNRYQGANVLMLGMTSAERGYTSPWWGTFKQITDLGGHVMKGQSEKNGLGGTTVFFAERREKEDDEVDPETGDPKRFGYTVAKAFRVFNASQCEGLPERFYPQPGSSETLAEPQAVLDHYLTHGGPRLDHLPMDRAYYTPLDDRIALPLRAQFRSPAHYYGTAFHEAIHSTGHPSRLNRPGIAKFDHFGSDRYAGEELVAETGSAMLLAETGLDNPALHNNSAAYLQSWLNALKGERNLVISAASQAYKAVELIIGT